LMRAVATYILYLPAYRLFQQKKQKPTSNYSLDYFINPEPTRIDWQGGP